MSESPWSNGAEKEREWIVELTERAKDQFREAIENPLKGRSVIKHFRKCAKKAKREGDMLAPQLEVYADVIERVLNGGDMESVLKEGAVRIERLNKALGLKSVGEILDSASPHERS